MGREVVGKFHPSIGTFEKQLRESPGIPAAVNGKLLGFDIDQPIMSQSNFPEIADEWWIVG